MDKSCIFHFLKKSDYGITKEDRGITVISIAAQAYDGLFLNCIKPEIKKILWKNQNGFWRNLNQNITEF